MGAAQSQDNEATRAKGRGAVAKSDKEQLLGLPRLQASKRSQKRGNITQTLRQRKRSRVSGRFSFFRSQALYRIYSVVPMRDRWLLPMLRDSLPGIAEAEKAETDAAAIADGKWGSRLPSVFLHPIEAETVSRCGQAVPQRHR